MHRHDLLTFFMCKSSTYWENFLVFFLLSINILRDFNLMELQLTKFCLSMFFLVVLNGSLSFLILFLLLLIKFPFVSQFLAPVCWLTTLSKFQGFKNKFWPALEMFVFHFHIFSFHWCCWCIAQNFTHIIFGWEFHWCSNHSSCGTWRPGLCSFRYHWWGM